MTPPLSNTVQGMQVFVGHLDQLRGGYVVNVIMGEATDWCTVGGGRLLVDLFFFYPGTNTVDILRVI